MRNVTPVRFLVRLSRWLPACLLAGGIASATAEPHEAAALMGDWCDDSGYRVELRAGGITFLDAQAPDPPPGDELVFAGNIAVYTQDFRSTPWPELDVVACSLKLTGPDSAEERCTGPGVGYRPLIPLKRCTPVPIS